MTDTLSIISLISFASIASACAALMFVVRDLFTGRGTVGHELRRLPKFRAGTGMLARFDLWFERALYNTGWGMSTLEGTLLIVFAMLLAGGTVMVLTERLELAIAAAIVALVGVFGTLAVCYRRRLKRFEQQFPSALELLARAVRAGESLDQGLALVGDAAHEPVGAELRRCAKQLEMGLSLSTCMQSLADRLDLMDVRIFSTALSVHREAGGNLPLTLERLAEVIRDRHSYHRQLQSVTAAGRFSSLLIAAAGPILFAYMFLFQPQYGGRLVTDPLGQILLVIAAVAQLIGLIWVFRLMKAEY